MSHLLFSTAAVVALLCAINVYGEEYVSISNGVLRIGIAPAHGGAIGELVDLNVPGVNLINCHDEGRYVQQSYYAGPDPYRGGTFMGHGWPWNPISAGDRYGHKSQTLAMNSSDSHIYVKTRPLQWALDDVFCNCSFETHITLDANGAYVRNRLRNHRWDTTDYGSRSQETPALYTIGSLYELWSYTGSSPWTGGNLTKVTYPIPGPPWKAFSATENWAAFTDSLNQHYGVGVHHDQRTSFLGGFAGTQGQGGSHSPNTGYIAPLSQKDIKHDDEWVWCYHLAIGYLDTIRGYFQGKKGMPCRFPDV